MTYRWTFFRGRDLIYSVTNPYRPFVYASLHCMLSFIYNKCLSFHFYFYSEHWPIIWVNVCGASDRRNLLGSRQFPTTGSWVTKMWRNFATPFCPWRGKPCTGLYVARINSSFCPWRGKPWTGMDVARIASSFFGLGRFVKVMTWQSLAKSWFQRCI